MIIEVKTPLHKATMESRRFSGYQLFTFWMFFMTTFRHTFSYIREADVPYEDAGIRAFSNPLAESYNVLYVENEYLYIGAVHTPKADGPGHVFKVNTNDIRESVNSATFSVEHDTSQGAILCSEKTTNDTEMECRNFIKVVMDDPNKENKLLICGTNAEWSRCYHLDKSSLAQDGESFSGSSKCPSKPSETVTAIFGQDNKLYTALIREQSKPAIVRSQNSLSSTELQTEDDNKWLKESEFISSYSVTINGTEEVLFFFRETANENENQYPQQLTYSRVAKVCEVDKGGNTNVLSGRWSSYLKARLDCSVTSTSDGFNEFQQFYDVLEDTVKVDDVVYAVFSANRNGVTMPALCTYNVGNMSNVFDDGRYWDQEEVGKVWKARGPDLKPKPGECVADSTSLDDHPLNALKAHPLMDNLISSEQPPLLTSFIGIRFTKIVSTEVGSELILYIGTDRGTIMKVLYNNGSPYVLEEVKVAQNSSVPIVMAKSDNDTSLYIGFDDKVVQVPMYQCHRYTDCSQCNGAGDPHCAWNETSGLCVFDISPKSSCPTDPEPVQKQVQQNQRVILTCAVRNVEWTVNSASIHADGLRYINLDGTGLVITNFQESDAGLYEAKRPGKNDVIRSIDLWVTQSDSALEFLAPKLEDQNKATCQGRVVNLFCNADGPDGFTIMWRKPDGSAVTNESRVQWANEVKCDNARKGFSWLAVEVSANSTGSYTCEISDGMTTKTAAAEVSLQECVTLTTLHGQAARHKKALQKLEAIKSCPTGTTAAPGDNTCNCQVHTIQCSDCCSGKSSFP